MKDATAGDPIRGLKWTRKTLRTLTQAVRRKGFRVGHETVRRLLRVLRYTLRVNRKRLSRRQDPDRDRQMRHIIRQRRAFLKAGKPALSVDTKKVTVQVVFPPPVRAWQSTTTLSCDASLLCGELKHLSKLNHGRNPPHMALWLKLCTTSTD